VSALPRRRKQTVDIVSRSVVQTVGLGVGDIVAKLPVPARERSTSARALRRLSHDRRRHCHTVHRIPAHSSTTNRSGDSRYRYAQRVERFVFRHKVIRVGVSVEVKSPPSAVTFFAWAEGCVVAEHTGYSRSPSLLLQLIHHEVSGHERRQSRLTPESIPRLRDRGRSRDRDRDSAA
jgi:hypothetical protein